VVFHISSPGVNIIAGWDPDEFSVSSSKLGGIDEERPVNELVYGAWRLINITGMAAVNT